MGKTCSSSSSSSTGILALRVCRTSLTAFQFLETPGPYPSPAGRAVRFVWSNGCCGRPWSATRLLVEELAPEGRNTLVGQKVLLLYCCAPVVILFRYFFPPLREGKIERAKVITRWLRDNSVCFGRGNGVLLCFKKTRSLPLLGEQCLRVKVLRKLPVICLDTFSREGPRGAYGNTNNTTVWYYLVTRHY